MGTDRPARNLAVLVVLVLVARVSVAGDVFTSRRTGEKVTGTLLGFTTKDGDKHYIVKTADGRQAVLAEADWDIEREPVKPGEKMLDPPDRGAADIPKKDGRGTGLREPTESVPAPKVLVVCLDQPIEGKGAADSVVSALQKAAGWRAGFVMIEIDTPGGWVEPAEDVVRAIEGLKGAQAIAFVRGGRFRGAFSAGALIALSCDRIFMAEGSSIGAATPYVMTEAGPQFTEKMTSAFSAVFRALAERHKRPKDVAAAMVDPDIELREVTVGGKKEIVPSEVASERARGGAELGRWVTRRGKLLTLTAGEAVEFGIADKVCSSPEDVLKLVGLDEQSARTAVQDGYRPRVHGILKRIEKCLSIAKESNPTAADRFAILSGLVPGQGATCRLVYIGECLSLYEEVLRMAVSCPSLGLDPGAVRKKMVLLRQWREDAYKKPPSGL